jgi:O-acetyl-ADP-ribose deacetylase (regulator of RNase III)
VNRWIHSAMHSFASAHPCEWRQHLNRPGSMETQAKTFCEAGPMITTRNSCSCRGENTGDQADQQWLRRTLLRVLDELESLKAIVGHAGHPQDTIPKEVLQRMDHEYRQFLLDEQKHLEEFPVRPPPRPANLKEVPGNLFDDAPEGAALGHCVGADFLMGKGIAVEFRERFGHLDYLRSQHAQPGQVLTVPLFKANGDVERYIFHIVTKPKSANCLPRPHEFIPAVRKLASLCASLGVKTLALPRIGAGLDRQPWHWVRNIIEEEFTGVATEVLIFNKPTEFPVNECRRLTYSEAAATPHGARPTAQPPAQPPARNLHWKNKKKKKGTKEQQTLKVSPVERLARDLTKKDGPAQPGASQPDREGTMPDLTNPDVVPGRDDAFKVVTATVAAPMGGARCSTGACELTGAPSPSAPSTTPLLSGEKNLNFSPPVANHSALGAQNSAPDGIGTFSVDQTVSAEQREMQMTPQKTTQQEDFRTPTASDETLPKQLIVDLEVSSPVSLAIQRIEHNTVNANIRQQTYTKHKPQFSDNLAQIMSKNTTQNINHKVN